MPFAELKPHGTTAHTTTINGRSRCGGSRHKHHTMVAMADSLRAGMTRRDKAELSRMVSEKVEAATSGKSPPRLKRCGSRLEPLRGKRYRMPIRRSSRRRRSTHCALSRRTLSGYGRSADDPCEFCLTRQSMELSEIALLLGGVGLRTQKQSRRWSGG